MKAIGLCASYRRKGNTESVVRIILQKLSDKGIDTDFVRLTDFSIKPCTGCMRCVFKDEECHIDDDAYYILNKLNEADILIAGCPTYILGPAGILKMLIDRSMRFMLHAPEVSGNKRGCAISISGVKGWEGFNMAFIKILLFSLGFKPLISASFYAQGPSEILLSEKIESKLENIANVLYEGKVSEDSNANKCPVCRENIFLLHNNGQIECPICELEGKLVYKNDVFEIDFSDISSNRWEPDNIKRHFNDNVLPSGPRYIKSRQKIKELIRYYGL